MLKHTLLLLFVVTSTITLGAAKGRNVVPALIPQPTNIASLGKTTNFTSLSFVVPQELSQAAALVKSVIGCSELGSKKPKFTVVVKLDSTLSMPCEGYRLQITTHKAIVTASAFRGAVWGLQTFGQLVTHTQRQGFSVPLLEIQDAPAFAMRGFMHDTGRNFIEIEMLKRHIDLMSRYKLNLFHWHLTDYPAWRIESKRFPQLNDPKFQRKGRDEGRFYTYDQIRDLIDYAHHRGIMVVPEIDIPGHSTYFASTFGFSMDSPEGRAVLEEAFAEFFAEIPISLTPYMHIGSDEVRIAAPAEFMRWAQDLIRRYGRQTIVWDPGLPSDSLSIRQIWNEAEVSNKSAADRPGRYLDSFMGYLNYYDPIVYVNRVIQHTPCGITHGNRNALGGILCLWNDVRVADKSKIEVHSGMMPGMLPFAERFWCGGVRKGVANQNLLSSPQSVNGKIVAEFHARMIEHRNRLLQGVPFHWVSSADIPWRITTPHQRGTDTTATQLHTLYGGVVEMDSFMTYLKQKSTAPMDCFATTEIFAAKDSVIRAWIGFEAPARSNRISGGIGEQGKWENEGRITVNDIAVVPAVAWNEPSSYKFHFHTWHKPQEEFPYTDEQFYWMRTPAYVPLKKGWNKIEVFAPKTFAGQRWSFAFIPLTVNADGTFSEVQGIKYR